MKHGAACADDLDILPTALRIILLAKRTATASPGEPLTDTVTASSEEGVQRTLRKRWAETGTHLPGSPSGPKLTCALHITGWAAWTIWKSAHFCGSNTAHLVTA